jgi:hypothetical protein
VGVAAGGASAFIKGALTTRAKTGEELRDRRLEAYPPVWRQSATTSLYPAAEISWADLKALHLAYRRWYFTTGGIFLSKRSRDRYGDAQLVIGAYLRSHETDDPSARVSPADYDAIARTCSAIRTAMTEDLATRRQRSLALSLESWWWHSMQKRKAAELLARFGNDILRCPIDELTLPPPDPG